MRTANALKNVITSLILQIVVAISGILIPQFFIAIYGSAINGLVASISQFITYMSLVEAGISAAGMVALFKPLSMQDTNVVNAIISATRRFYFQSGMAFVALVFVLMLFYPRIVQSEVGDSSFVRLMILVLSINGIVDYFFLGKYRVLLNADQKMYVISVAQILGTIVVTIISIILMRYGCSAILVKSTAASIYILRSIMVAIYVKRKYRWLDFKAIPDTSAFSQRWAALVHQIVGMIVNNTDIVLLTVLLPEAALIQVSIYSVYSLVGYALTSALNSITNSLGSGFGEIISRGETKTLYKNYSAYEYVFYILIFTAYSCMIVLLYPFMKLYSASFSDAASYVNWNFVILFSLVGIIQTIRYPGLTLIIAAGHYKQTQVRAIIEASINIIVSVGLIFHYGIVGVLLGTCASYLYRTIDVIIYAAKFFVIGTLKKSFFRIIRNALITCPVIIFGITVVVDKIHTWVGWFEWACILGILTLLFLTLVNVFIEPNEFKYVIQKIKQLKC